MTVGPATDGPVTTATVVSLWRYPLKSMLGEPLEQCAFTSSGVLGDRAAALFDRETGKVVSAKNPLKWGGVFGCRSAFVRSPQRAGPLPPIQVTFPDGAVARTDDPGFAEAASVVLGRAVRLVTIAPQSAQFEQFVLEESSVLDAGAPPDGGVVTAGSLATGTLFDGASVHLLTTSTLAELARRYPQGRFDERRFRPNLVVDPVPPVSGFVEGDWLGHELALGEDVVLRVTRDCKRCVMTTLAQDDLPKDRGILQTVARNNGLRVGVYAEVLRSGIVRTGDKVVVT